MNIKHHIKDRLYRAYKSIETKEHHLAYLFLEITRRCNLNCLHCGSDCKAEVNAGELTTESWFKLIDYVAHHFSTDVAFVITGGEPLLHRDLERIGQRIANHGMRWGMVSNGMVLSKERLEKLIAAGLDSITLSVDGLEDAHNLIRNHPKAFTQINQALAVVGNSSLAYKDAVTCVFPPNLNQLNDLADILLSHKIRSWRLFRIFPSGRATDNDLLLLSFEQTQQLLQWIAQNKKKYQAQGLTINLSCEGWLPMSLDEQVRDTPFFCRAGINIASILSDGTITGCSNNHSSFHVGNVLKDDLAYVWENKFDDFRQREWVKETTCSNCEHIRSCKGNSIHLWDKNNAKPNFCYVKDLSLPI